MVGLHENLLAQRYGHTLTDLLYELKGDPEAIGLFEEFHPGLWDDLAEQGYRCLDLDHFPQSTAIFDFVLAYREEEVAYQAAYADSLHGLRDYLAAGDFYLQAIHQAPEIPDAYFYLGEVWMILRHPQYALPCLETVQSLLEAENREEHPLWTLTQERLAYAKQALDECEGTVAKEALP